MWERFLKAHPDKYKHYDYDVRVGTGRDPGAQVPPNIRRMASDLSKRRIDAVGYTDSHLTIIEITLSAGLRAIGQLIVYPYLFRDTNNIATLPDVLLVAAEIQTDIKSILDELRLPYLLFPGPTDRTEAL